MSANGHSERVKQVTNVKDYPLTTTSLVSFDTEGKIYAKCLAGSLPNAKYAILYQNDDLGKDYVNAFKAVLKEDFDRRVVTAAYEITDPTIDSQIVNLKSSGAEALLVAATPKFAAQAIRKVAEIGWKTTVILNYPSSSVGATLRPAGLSTGVIVGTMIMDPTDSQWDGNEGMRGFRVFVDKYMPDIDIADTNYLFGYTQGLLLFRRSQRKSARRRLGIGAGITGQKRTFYEGRLPPQHVLQTSSRITDLAEEEPM
jgi:branched-chain amino acid transport system substrate-binding protein